MASFVNSFALLEGSAPREPTAPSKKKKSKKNKTSTSSALPPSDQGGSAAAAPGSEDDTPVDDGFQVAGKSSKKGSASNFKDASPARKLRSLMEGIADLETASRQAPFRDNTDRVAQWRSWRQQASDSSGESFSDGSTSYSFKDVLLISEALEISAQRCLEAPFPTESDLQDYKSLLAACLPSCVFNGQAQALLSAIGQLGKVITAFSSKKDMKGQAQQAISAVIAFLKEPQGQTETTSSAPFFDSEILDLAAAQARELEDMGKKISDVSTWRGSRDIIQQAVKLSMDHMDLISDRAAPSPDSKGARAISALDSLVQELAAPEQAQEPSSSTANGKPPEDDMHLQQLEAIRVKIRECEAVLDVLRQQEQDHLASVPPSQRHRIKQVQVNGFEPHATPEQVECLETLREYMISSKGPLRDPSGLSASGFSEGQLSEAAQFLLANLERLLHANKIAATETSSKAQETAGKLASAIKTGRTLQMLEMRQEDVAKNREHQQNYEKQLKGLVASIERTMRESREYAKAMDRYKALLHSIWSRQDVQSWVLSFSTVIKQTQAAYDAALEATENKCEAPSQRASVPVSLSHADPVVQPTQSSAGAVGSSATPAVRAESCQNSLEAERQALEDGAATSEPAAEGCPTATSPDDAAQHLGFDSRPGQAGMMNGRHNGSQANASRQPKGRRNNGNRRD